jgi:hypothetical protein
MGIEPQPSSAKDAHKSAQPLGQKLSNDHDQVLKTFRLLIADLCQQLNGGHPGYASRSFIYINILHCERLIIVW